MSCNFDEIVDFNIQLLQDYLNFWRKYVIWKMQWVYVYLVKVLKISWRESSHFFSSLSLLLSKQLFVNTAYQFHLSCQFSFTKLISTHLKILPFLAPYQRWHWYYLLCYNAMCHNITRIHICQIFRRSRDIYIHTSIPERERVCYNVALKKEVFQCK